MLSFILIQILFLNQQKASLIGIVLFVGFGFKMLSEASEKPPQSPQAPIST